MNRDAGIRTAARGLWLDVARRDRRPELMDDPAIDPSALRRALRGIERLNLWSNSARILWRPLRAALLRAPRRPLRVLDIGTGSGDLPIALWRRARRQGFDVTIDGCDVSPTAVALAVERATACDAPSRFWQADALLGDIPSGYDVLMCSLFLHHLSDADAAALLLRMRRAAGRMVLVNDLVRSRVGLWLAYAATGLLSASQVVRVDGPLSVRGAFTIAEAQNLADRAGMTAASVRACWPCRFLLRWERA